MQSLFFAQNSISEVVKNFSLSDTLTAIEFYKKADSLSSAAQYDSSNYYFEKARNIYELAYQRDSNPDFIRKILYCENEIGWNLKEQGLYDFALIRLTQALDFGLKQLDENNIEVAQLYNIIGVIYWAKGNYKYALENYQKSLTINLYLSGEDSPNVASGYNNIGIVYNVIGDYDKALEYYQKNLAIKQKIKTKDLNEVEIANSYTNIGLLYYLKGDYKKALDYLNRTLLIRLHNQGEYNPYTANSYTNLGTVYAAKGDYNTALNYFYKSLDINSRLFDELNPKVGSSYDNIGSAYFYLTDYNNALEYCKKALAIKGQTLGERHPKIIHNFIMLGKIFNKKEDFINAKIFLDKAISLGIELYGLKHPEVGSAYRTLAETFYMSNDYNSAIKFCQLALISLVQSFDDYDFISNPVLTDIVSETELLSTLHFKAKIFSQPDQISGQADLELSLSTYQLAIELIDKMRIGFKADASKLFLRERLSDLFEEALYTCLKLYQSNNDSKFKSIAFNINEKSKLALLEESLNEVQAKQFSKLPAELLEKEKQLKIDLAFYDTQLQKEYNKKGKKDTLLIKQYEDLLFDLKTNYENLISEFEKEFPDYYNLRYQTSTVSVDEIRTKLKENTALVEYFVGEKSIYIFIISRDEFDIISFEKPTDFMEIAKSFYSSILKTEREEYIISGNKLSEILIIPILNNPAITDKSKLVIIPDDILYKIPFEALFTSIQKTTLTDYHEFDYVINDFDLSYHYSATLFHNSRKSEKVEVKNFAGFAPVFPDNYLNGYTLTSDNLDYLASDSDELLRSVTVDGKKFHELKHSEWEVKTIIDLFKQERKEKKSVGYFYTNANEENFKINISVYDIVHIATHSFINETYPQISGIVFAQPENNQISLEDGILYAGEIYNLDLNADLVVMSSCESGLGKLIKGEGMMALTRGFLYAGADNVLFSLWKVSDKPTSELMVEFYRNTLSGKSYSESLREAKLSLIKNSSTSRPRSWASFVLIGGN